MSSLLTNRFALIVAALLAIGGWLAFFLAGDPSDQGADTASQATAELEQSLSELQARYDELQSDHEGLLQETIALRTLNESRQEPATEEAGAADEIESASEPELGVSRFPVSREQYLEIKLSHASKHLNRLRSHIRELNSELAAAAESDVAEGAAAVSEAESAVSEFPEPGVSRFPIDREKYLETRLTYASKQLRRLRAQNRQLNLQPDAAVDSSIAADAAAVSAVSGISELGVSRFPLSRDKYLETRLTHASKHLRRLRAQIRQLNDEVDQAMAQLASASGEAETLESQPMSSSEPAADMQSETIDSAPDESSDTVSSQAAEAAASATEAGSVEANRAEYQNAMAGLVEELNLLIVTISDMSDSAETEDSDIRDSDDGLADNRAHQLLDRLGGLRERLRQVEASSMSQSAGTEAKIADLERNLADSDVENEQLNARLVEIMDGFEEERTYYVRTIESLMEELDQAVAVITDAGESEKVDAPAVSQNEAEPESDWTEQLLDRVNQLQERLRAAEESGTSLADANARVADLSQRLKGADDQNLRLQLELHSLNNKVELLEVELANADHRNRNSEKLQASIKQENKQLAQLIKDMRAHIDITIAEKTNEITNIQSGYAVIVLSTDILFESGSAALSENGQRKLMEIGAAIKDAKFDDRIVSVEGHTDNVPISGNLLSIYPTNWELSSARASSATRFLVAQGITADRIRAVGFGERKPTVSNETAAGRAANRRIEIHLVPVLKKVGNRS